MFKVKRNADGSVERYKARLVAKGFSQRPGLEYDETFASTLKWSTLRTILAIAAIEDLEVESIDFSTAYLNGELDKEVYMKQPGSGLDVQAHERHLWVEAIWETLVQEAGFQTCGYEFQDLEESLFSLCPNK